jgi:hypothetical protein
MRTVTVSMVGADHQEHSFTIEASGLFDACRQAIKGWARYWWYDPIALLTVKCGEEQWYVRQAALRTKN